MIVREATSNDIPRMHEIRMRVKENALSDPLLVTEKDYPAFITGINKGWVAISDSQIIGFAIVDAEHSNIWALFVDPGSESCGAGQRLQRTMLDWYFAHYTRELWLSTSPQTRAERFYNLSGWKNSGMLKNGEVKFVMDIAQWKTPAKDLQS